MIECFTKATSHHLPGNPYWAQAYLRYRTFKPLQWKIPFFDEANMEEDEYDVPTTVYFLKRDDRDRKPLAAARYCRTDKPYRSRGSTITFMLMDHFNQHVKNQDLLVVGEKYREGSRICVHPDLQKPENKELRRRSVNELMVGMLEYCCENGIQGVYGVMPVKVYESTYGRIGCPSTWLSDPVEIDSIPSQLAIKHISLETLSRAREVFGIPESVLCDKTKACKDYTDCETATTPHVAAMAL